MVTVGDSVHPKIWRHGTKKLDLASRKRVSALSRYRALELYCHQLWLP